MPAPKKVKEKASLADQLIAQRANTPPGDQPPPQTSRPELAVVTDQPAKPQVNQYAFDPAASAPPARQPEAPAQEGWEHKYNVLKGMFDKFKDDSSDRVRQLENQIDVLTQMARPTSPQETFHPQPAAPLSVADYGLTEEQIEEVGGAEFVEQIARISGAASQAQIQSLQAEVSELKASQTDSLDESFYATLTSLSPNWRTVNKDERFDEWLLVDEGLSGIPRRNFLTNAYENRDAETAAKYFNEFAGAAPSPPNLNPDVLQDIIPGSSGGSSPPGSTSNATYYTPAGIASFFKDKGLGKFKGREAEAEAIEMDIFAAQQEGRVVDPRRQPRRIV